ncbi:hypothetical protein F4561_002502 [Lipingzhangella halophila]|uniref:Uncharacterized protein n=1 Tax=Lipingzhangella halophila TaxID=1783352 RepID=A0A7W7RGS1_9ACTN|nr:DUF6243 family protein [Lipingzhangella halophila]MBB4931682.1 hypothetical protein [Lipingzhangella halophila]
MAKRHNPLLGLGEGRTKPSPSDRQDSGPGSARNDARASAGDHKQELLRKMRERAQAEQPAEADKES